MAKMQLLNKYTVMKEETGEFIREGSKLNSITYYEEDLRETVVENNVEVIGIDDFGVEIQKDNSCYVYIELDALEDFD